MILKNNSERVINLIRYFESLSIENKLTILVLKSDLIKFKLDKEKMIKVLERFLCAIDKSYNRDTLIFLKNNMDVFVLAMVMKMNEEEQKNYIYEMVFHIYNNFYKFLIIKNYLSKSSSRSSGI